MISFFRKIRRQLVQSGLISKYGLYAFGEIALVVIGILIALQINNWNEGRKERVLESVVLEDIRDNIVRNHELIYSAIETIDSINKSTDLIEEAARNGFPFEHTMGHHLNQAMRSGTFLFKLNSDGYQSLQSTGFNLIQNESLKDHILRLFEVNYGYVLTTRDFANMIYVEDSGWWKDYLYTDYEEGLIPYDKENIFKNKRFLTEIREIAFLRNDFRRALDGSLKESHNVLDMINGELDK